MPARGGVRNEGLKPEVMNIFATLGILFFAGAARLVGGRLPPGLHLGDLLTLGIAASIGFTVSLFFATAAFPEGTALAQTKMGALLSFAAAPLAVVAGRILRRPVSVAT